jgi:hypothetical protein
LAVRRVRRASRTRHLPLPGVVVLELEHQRDAGQVQARVEQHQHAPYPVQVDLAVAAGAAVRPRRLDESPLLVDPEVLDPGAGQLGRHRDRVDGSTARIWIGGHGHSCAG